MGEVVQLASLLLASKSSELHGETTQREPSSSRTHFNEGLDETSNLMPRPGQEDDRSSAFGLTQTDTPFDCTPGTGSSRRTQPLATAEEIRRRRVRYGKTGPETSGLRLS